MVFGFTTKNSSDKFSINDGLENDEQVIEVYHRTVHAQNGPLMKHFPYKTQKEWRKTPAWKDVKEHFYALTNKRWLFVNYDTRSVIESYDLSKYDVLAGRDSITFMNGIKESFSVNLGDNLRIVQVIKHLQASLPSRAVQQNVSVVSVQPPPDDPLKVLKVRFAKGEISKEEFEDMKKMLE